MFRTKKKLKKFILDSSLLFRWGYLGDTEGYAYGMFAIGQVESMKYCDIKITSVILQQIHIFSNSQQRRLACRYNIMIFYIIMI